MRHINRNFLLMAVLAGGMYRAESTDLAAGAPVLAPDPTEAAKPVPAEKPAELTEAQKAEAEATKQAFFAEIKAKFNHLVDIKETNFHFRKVTNEIKDPETGKISKIETKRPTVSLPIPVPSIEGIIEILSKGEGKGVELLQEAVAAVILEQAREYINDHENVSEANFPYETMSWEAIANLPKAERRGGGISKETWEEFSKDYVEVMPGVTGKTKEQVEMAAKVFMMKFAGATTNKPVLRVLQGQLGLYASNTPRAEEFAACIGFLADKVEKLINTDETNLLAAL